MFEEGKKMTDFLVERIQNREMFPVERAYIALFGGECWEVVGVRPDGVLDTAFGNSRLDAEDRAARAGLQPV